MSYSFHEFSYEQFAQEFLYPIQNKTLQYLVFQAYRSMVSGIPLSQIYSGSRYTKVRDTMLNTYIPLRGTVLTITLAERSSEYIPLAFPITVPRIFPMGHYVEFDIFNKYPYVTKDTKTTVQIRFRMWIPFGAFLVGKKLLNLFVVFYPIAERIFNRINVESSLEAMDEAQHVQFVIGSKRVKQTETIRSLNNISTITVSIKKVRSSITHKYIYDFVVRYQYVIDDLGGNMYRVRLCHFQILKAISCTTGDDLFKFYRDVYYDKYGVELTKEDYNNILDACPFTWKLYKPARTPLCSSLVDVNTLI